MAATLLNSPRATALSIYVVGPAKPFSAQTD